MAGWASAFFASSQYGGARNNYYDCYSSSGFGVAFGFIWSSSKYAICTWWLRSPVATGDFSSSHFYSVSGAGQSYVYKINGASTTWSVAFGLFLRLCFEMLRLYGGCAPLIQPEQSGLLEFLREVVRGLRMTKDGILKRSVHVASRSASWSSSLHVATTWWLRSPVASGDSSDKQFHWLNASGVGQNWSTAFNTWSAGSIGVAFGFSRSCSYECT